jgi:hypothetical protein
MPKYLLRIQLPALALCLAMAAMAQSSQGIANPAANRAITNADVIRMLKSGIPKDTIILAIQKGPDRLNSSIDALIALKNAGADQDVLDAIITNSPMTDVVAPSATPAAGTGPMTGVPEAPGVYFKRGGQWVALQQIAAYSIRAGGANNFAAILTRGVGGVIPVSSVMLFNGAHAGTHLSEASPAFYIVNMDLPNGGPLFVRMQSKKNRRQVQIGRSTVMGTSQQYDPKNVVPALVTRTSGVVRITPAHPLQPGDYFISLSQLPVQQGFDFTVAPSAGAPRPISQPAAK